MRQWPLCCVSRLRADGGAKTTTIWRMDAGGGNLKQLSDGKDDDGCGVLTRWKVGFLQGSYWVAKNLPGCLWKEGSRKDSPTFLPDRLRYISGQQAGGFYNLCLSRHSPRKQLALVPVGFSRRIRNFWSCNVRSPCPALVRFTHDGAAVVYPFHDRDAENLWLQPLDGSPGKQITNFKSERNHRLSLVFRWQQASDGPRPHGFRCCAPARVQTVSRWPEAFSHFDKLTKSGQHDRTPVTTKHEKRLYANRLFAVTALFKGGHFTQIPSGKADERYGE